MTNKEMFLSETGQSKMLSEEQFNSITKEALSILNGLLHPQGCKGIKPTNDERNNDVAPRFTDNQQLHDFFNQYKCENYRDTEINFYQLLIVYLALQRVIFGELASRVAANNSQESIIDINPDQSVMEVKIREWLTVDETSSRYRLPKNNIKSRKWRIENDFPYKGFDESKKPYSKVIFHSEEIEAWIKTHKR